MGRGRGKWTERKRKDDSTISDEESDDKEPRIKDVLNNLSQVVSRKNASDLLHSMATSKNILFWTPRGQVLRNQRITPVTNISELVEYMLLPYNEDVAQPHALNTFLDGFAVLGVNKNLIKNKKLLSDSLKKEQAYITITNLTARQAMEPHATTLRRKQHLRQTVNSKNPKERAILVDKKPKATMKLSTPTLKFKEK